MIVGTNQLTTHLLTGRELANRWGRSESAIVLASALGVGPRYLKIDGSLKYPLHEVQQYEQACLLPERAEAAKETMN